MTSGRDVITVGTDCIIESINVIVGIGEQYLKDIFFGETAVIV
jgi:hypothetical protein